MDADEHVRDSVLLNMLQNHSNIRDVRAFSIRNGQALQLKSKMKHGTRADKLTTKLTTPKSRHIIITKEMQSYLQIFDGDSMAELKRKLNISDRQAYKLISILKQKKYMNVSPRWSERFLRIEHHFVNYLVFHLLGC